MGKDTPTAQKNNSGKKRIIIPVASGKGGVGKTLLSANLGLALAANGFDTVVADLDIGGPNLHTFLAIANTFPGIGDFIKTKSIRLEELIVNTSIKGLRFLPGSGVTPFMANIQHAEKQRLLKNLKKIDADYLILDLGAGTTFNILDFFSITSRGLLITNPEFPALISLLGFLKNLVFRLIKQEVASHPKSGKVLEELFNSPMSERQVTVSILKEHLTAVDPAAAEKIDSLCAEFRPAIIFNSANHPNELKIANQLGRGLKNVLNLNADYFGFVFYDKTVKTSLKERKPYLLNYPDNIASLEIQKIAARIINYWNRPIEESYNLLLNSCLKIYEQFH